MNHNRLKVQQSLEYLINTQRGIESELYKRFSEKEIHSFESLGYIHEGIEVDGTKTWKVSSRARDDYRALFPRDGIVMRIADFFAYHILRLKASM